MYVCMYVCKCRWRESPRYLPTKPVPEAFELLFADWPEKYPFGQSARRSSRVTLVASFHNVVYLMDRRCC